MYDQVVKCQRAGLCLSEHFLFWLEIAYIGLNFDDFLVKNNQICES